VGRKEKTPEKEKKDPFLRKGTPSERNRVRADVHTAKAKKDRTFLPATNPQGARLVGAVNQKLCPPINREQKGAIATRDTKGERAEF